MQYYLIQKVRWFFNSFLTKMLNRSTNVALAGNTKIDESLHRKKTTKRTKKKPLKLRCLGGLFVLENHKKDQ